MLYTAIATKINSTYAILFSNIFFSVKIIFLVIFSIWESPFGD